MSALHYQDEHVTLWHGDCLDVLRGLPGNSVDAVVTDPPYGLVFMGKAWDDHVDGKGFQAWCEQWASECLRVLKPGGHMLAFGGTRTWHRLACAVEDAGFEVRDSIAWLYGSGFPKSLDVAKAITGTQTGHGSNSGAIRRATMGADYEPSGVRGNRDGVTRRSDAGMAGRDLPLTADAEQWQGWGTALKPAFEPIVVARKPLVGTVAANVLTHGTGALNIDGCRVATTENLNGGTYTGTATPTTGDGWRMANASREFVQPAGRWPANVVLDDTQAAELDRQSGILTSGANPTRRGSDKFRDAYGDFKGQEECTPARGADSGGASRFFPTFRYQAKASTAERPRAGEVAHPTVKPLDLMRWLVRLVAPPGGKVLDLFAGSGTTGEACVLEGLQCLLIEREADYLPLIVSRLVKPLQMGLDIEGWSA